MNTKFTKGPWVRCSRGENLIGANGKNVGVYNSGLSGVNKSVEAVANVHLIEASTDMYRSLVRQRKGLLNLIELEAINKNYIKAVRHEISLIDNELSKARGE